MTAETDLALMHYDTAMQALDQLRELLLNRPDAQSMALLDSVREHTEQGFWLAHLGVASSRQEIAATPYCRRIPLTAPQSRNLALLRRGMLQAQHSLAPGGLAAPWNALFCARQQFRLGMARQCYEAGFLIRFFQLLQEARHGVPHWTMGEGFIAPNIRHPRYQE